MKICEALGNEQNEQQASLLLSIKWFTCGHAHDCSLLSGLHLPLLQLLLCSACNTGMPWYSWYCLAAAVCFFFLSYCCALKMLFPICKGVLGYAYMALQN
jgi:hypothetical protein